MKIVPRLPGSPQRKQRQTAEIRHLRIAGFKRLRLVNRGESLFQKTLASGARFGQAPYRINAGERKVAGPPKLFRYLAPVIGLISCGCREAIQVIDGVKSAI